VLTYLDLPGAKDFFARFNIPIGPFPRDPLESKYIDFSTGLPVPNYPADQGAMMAALGAYGQVVAGFVNQTFPGYFDLPEQVPDDLALPFGRFVAKYNLQAALPFLWQFVSAVGDVLAVPALFVIQNLNAVVLNLLQQPDGFFVPSSHNNSELYAAVQQYLSADLLLSSTVSVADRSDSGVKLVVNTPSGKKLVKAKKLLVTAAPTISNLKALDLDTTEKTVFGKWEWTSDWVGVISHTGLPDGLDLVNTVPDSSPSALNLPKSSYVSSIGFSRVPGLYKVTVIGPPDLSEHRAKIMVREALGAVGDAGTLPTKHIDFEAFSSHAPLQLRVSTEELKSGFFKKLYALQGRSSTFYTGAAWTMDYSAAVWLFTEVGVLPQMLPTL
jgi:hypothetical protein